ncbi:unnamed protein product [Citrullus colocynthis]|uniref:Secreted protein n=1 Tax=Citrullus colocynthis TaxID=252529 RepID=A0ABP0Z1K8_9ROSI
MLAHLMTVLVHELLQAHVILLFFAKVTKMLWWFQNTNFLKHGFCCVNRSESQQSCTYGSICNITGVKEFRAFNQFLLLYFKIPFVRQYGRYYLFILPNNTSFIIVSAILNSSAYFKLEHETTTLWLL